MKKFKQMLPVNLQSHFFSLSNRLHFDLGSDVYGTINPVFSKGFYRDFTTETHYRACQGFYWFEDDYFDALDFKIKGWKRLKNK